MQLSDIRRRWLIARREFALGEISGTTFLAEIDSLRAHADEIGADELRYDIDLSAVPALSENRPDELLTLIPQLRTMHQSDPQRFPDHPRGSEEAIDGRSVVSYFDTHIARSPAIAALNASVPCRLIYELLRVVNAELDDEHRHEIELAVAVVLGDQREVIRLFLTLPDIDPQLPSDERYFRAWNRVLGLLTLGRYDEAIDIARSLADECMTSALPAGILARLVGPLSHELDRETMVQWVNLILKSSVGVPELADAAVLAAAFLAEAGLIDAAVRLVHAAAFDVDTFAPDATMTVLARALGIIFGAAERAGYGTLLVTRFTTPRWQRVFAGSDGTVADLARRARSFASRTAALFGERNGNDSFTRYIFAPTDIPPVDRAELAGTVVDDTALSRDKPISVYPRPKLLPEHVEAFFYEAMGDEAGVSNALARAAVLPEQDDLSELYRLREKLITSDDDIALDAAHELGELYLKAGEAARELIRTELLLSASLLDTDTLLGIAVQALPSIAALDTASGVGLALDVAAQLATITGRGDAWRAVIDYAADLVLSDVSKGEEKLIASDLGELTQEAVRGGDYLTALLVNRRLLRIYDEGYEGANASIWSINTYLGRAQLLSSVGNSRAALEPAEIAQRLAIEAGNDERHIQAVAVRIEILFENRDLRTASALSRQYRDIPTGKYPLQEFLLRHGQAMVACTLVEPNFTETWPEWSTLFTEAGARVLRREKDSASLVLRRTSTLVTLLGSLNHPVEAEDLAAWLVSTASAVADDEVLNEALLHQATLFFQHNKHSNAGLILESVIQRAHRIGDTTNLNRALRTLESWALHADDPEVSQTYLTIMIGIT
ncbi:hypothetical protein QP027_00915 [Corynebacterium breve]|uniref:Death domain-containing protein n=1 Tax=Corynebacterium breve TaxID=3049799 RepID=A0ABY8VF73_9CORY|nr:hypothetical protein [Corynebacterium breve]WIM67992.1 hypothetical protein QP027_00915 [Corynebacterium breve]